MIARIWRRIFLDAFNIFSLAPLVMQIFGRQKYYPIFSQQGLNIQFSVNKRERGARYIMPNKESILNLYLKKQNAYCKTHEKWISFHKQLYKHINII